MKILFVYKNVEWLGIEYLSSVLKKHGHTTDLLFDSGCGDIEFKMGFLEKYFAIENMMLEKARNFDPDLIAFSCLTNIHAWVDRMATLLKKKLNKPIIVGGIHPTMVPEYTLSNENIDMVCLGEGEDALLELVQSLERDNPNYNIQNIWFKNNGKIIKNPMRPLIEDLDVLPLPDKDLFYKYGCFKDRLYVMTARGCPYKCTYCFNHTYNEMYRDVSKSYVRNRSIENVIDELLVFKKKYPVKEIFFYDDIFTLNQRWVSEFSEEYKKSINLPFKCLIRPGTVTLELLKTMKDAGCLYVDIGLESGDEHVRKNILKRRIDDSQIIETCDFLKKVGIKFTTLNIVGMPGENSEQMLRTLELNQKIRPTTAIFTTFYPFPKTALTEKAFEKGYLHESEREDVLSGKGSYKEDSILSHPDKDVLKWVVTFSPILVKYPFLTPVFKKLTPNRFFRFITIFFSSPLRNIKIRLFELIVMFIKTRRALNVKEIEKRVFEKNDVN